MLVPREVPPQPCATPPHCSTASRSPSSQKQSPNCRTPSVGPKLNALKWKPRSAGSAWGALGAAEPTEAHGSGAAPRPSPRQWGLKVPGGAAPHRPAARGAPRGRRFLPTKAALIQCLESISAAPPWEGNSSSRCGISFFLGPSDSEHIAAPSAGRPVPRPHAGFARSSLLSTRVSVLPSCCEGFGAPRPTASRAVACCAPYLPSCGSRLAVQRPASSSRVAEHVTAQPCSQPCCPVPSPPGSGGGGRRLMALGRARRSFEERSSW